MEPTNQEYPQNTQLDQSKEILVDPNPQNPPSNKRKILIIPSILTVVILIIGLIVGYVFRDFFFLLSTEQKQNATTTSPTAPIITIVETISNFTLYKNEQFRYELEYPANWEIIEAKPRIGSESAWRSTILSAEELQKVTFLEQGEKNLLGSFQVRVEENANNDDIETWIEDNTPTTVSGAGLISNMSDTTLDNEGAKNLSVYRFDHSDTNIVVKKDNYIYVLEFTESNPNDPDFEEHKKVYEQMVSSFRFLEASIKP